MPPPRQGRSQTSHFATQSNPQGDPALPTPCPECGAPVGGGATWRDTFHALLYLEAEVPGGPGSVAHFLARHS